MTRVLVAGVSTRAAAASAAEAGYDVVAIDGYADRDQHQRVHALSLPRDAGVPFSAAAAAAAARQFDTDAAAYLSNFENDLDAVAVLGTSRSLWGNPHDVLRRARDPFIVARLFDDHGIPTARVRTHPGEPNDPTHWLHKPLASGGGHGIRPWTTGAVGRRHYLQERIDGTAGSVVFVAAEGRAVTMGISRQLIGDARFGVSGYRYCGNILAPASQHLVWGGDTLTAAVDRLAAIAAAELLLVGVNGIDFVARDEIPYPIEINPRWTASMELIERACGVNVFAAHAMACSARRLPDAMPAVPGAVGKAVVFARADSVVGDTDAWLADPDIRDVPHSGHVARAGTPVCSVFAAAPDAAECELELVRRAERIYRDLEDWSRTLAT